MSIFPEGPQISDLSAVKLMTPTIVNLTKAGDDARLQSLASEFDKAGKDGRLHPTCADELRSMALSGCRAIGQ